MKKFLLFPLALAAVIACNKQTPDPDPEPEPEPKPEPTPEYVVYGGEIITKSICPRIPRPAYAFSVIAL